MGWELHIRANQDVERFDPLGSGEEVRRAVESFFPDTRWDAAGCGICDCVDGVVEFEFDSGDPVSMIMITVRDGDPSLRLIALAREKHWIVEDDAAGELLENEVLVDEASLEQLTVRLREERVQASAKTEPGKAPRLPRVKSKVRADELTTIAVETSHLVVLRPEETTSDIFEEYIRFVAERNLLKATNRHPMHGNEELHLSDGRRAGILFILDDAPPLSYNILADFFRETGRVSGRMTNGVVSLSDGWQFKLEECWKIQRASGRRRRAGN